MFKIRSLQLIRGSNPDDIAAYDLRPNHGLPFFCAWVKVGNHLWRARVGRVRSPAKICKQLGNRQMTLRNIPIVAVSEAAIPQDRRRCATASSSASRSGAAIFRHACWMALEGIVSKRIGSRYVSGQTRAWLK